MGKVTGIGGIFIKCNNPEEMNNWYRDVLGMTTNPYGVLFSFNDNTSPKGFLQLGIFPSDSDYFGSEHQQAMLNFRVDNMTEMLEVLKTQRVRIVKDLEEYEYGKFVHILDLEGNRIELWEPMDGAFEKEAHMAMC
ncbi:MAG: VOC family protein [Crocinitomicaceae bacterium]|nr:VOC family protein [Crocinitomicaceae bacterium]